MKAINMLFAYDYCLTHEGFFLKIAFFDYFSHAKIHSNQQNMIFLSLKPMKEDSYILLQATYEFFFPSLIKYRVAGRNWHLIEKLCSSFGSHEDFSSEYLYFEKCYC